METKVTDDEALALFSNYVEQVIEKANRAQALEQAVKELKGTLDYMNENLKSVRGHLFDKEAECVKLRAAFEDRGVTINNLKNEIDTETKRREQLRKSGVIIEVKDWKELVAARDGLAAALKALEERDITISDLRDEIELHDDEIEGKDDWMKAIAYDWAQAQKSLEARVKWLEENTKKYP